MVPRAVLLDLACRGSRLKAADSNRLNKLIWKAGDVVGVKLDSLEMVIDRRMLKGQRPRSPT